jgi:hypothetical protein
MLRYLLRTPRRPPSALVQDLRTGEQSVATAAAAASPALSGAIARELTSTATTFAPLGAAWTSIRTVVAAPEHVQATAVSAQPDRSSAMIRVSIIPGPRAGPSGLQGHLHPEAIRRRAQCPLRPARGLPTSASRQSYKDSRDDNAGGDEDGRGGGCRGIGLVRGPR